MKLKYKQFAFITLVILVFLLSIVAASATPIRGEKISECSCLIFSNPIEIQNTGSSVDGFHISQSGKASEWSELIPEVVILELGETVIVDNLINIPCDSKGNSKLYTTIRSSDSTEHFTQVINVMDCSSIQKTESLFKVTSLESLIKFLFIVLLIIFLLFLFIYLLLFGKDRLFYRSVNIRRPKQKKTKKKEKKSKKRKLLSPSAKNLLLKIFSLVILVILAFIVFKGIQEVVSEKNQSLEVEEIVVLPEEIIEPEIEELSDKQDEQKVCSLTCLKDNKIYLLYSAAGFAILLLLLFVLTRLKNRPKKARKKKKTKSNKSKKSNCKKTIEKCWNWIIVRWKQALLMFLIIIILILLFISRGLISMYLASLKDYVLIYLTYIILGFLMLGIMIVVFSKLNR